MEENKTLKMDEGKGEEGKADNREAIAFLIITTPFVLWLLSRDGAPCAFLGPVVDYLFSRAGELLKGLLKVADNMMDQLAKTIAEAIYQSMK